MENRRLVIARGSGGTYDPACFRLEREDAKRPERGEILVRTRLLSLDPTHLNWIKLDPVFQYLPLKAGDVMIGVNIGEVLESAHPDFVVGQIVMGTWGWEELAIARGDLVRVAMPQNEAPLDDQLALFSHVGQAAGGGLLIVGEAKAGEAVLVSAAAGATGSIAAQLARAMGCRTVGIAGGADKCRYLTEELGLDGAIDYRNDNMQDKIREYFPDGVDVFFDNVGGEILDAVLMNMAMHCRIALCGAIAQYEQDAGFGGIRNLPMLLFRRARIEGYIAGSFDEESNKRVLDALIGAYRKGQLHARKHVVSFEEMPQALLLFLNGGNKGKLMASIP